MTIDEAIKILEIKRPPEKWDGKTDVNDYAEKWRTEGFIQGHRSGYNSAIEHFVVIIKKYIDEPYTSDTQTEAENILKEILDLKDGDTKSI